MGKRSDFERIERDFYPTPMEAVKPLSDQLSVPTWFVEPCAGDGALVRHLCSFGHNCAGAYDIEPQHKTVFKGDALFHPLGNSTVITNPPWDRKFLHPFIERCIAHGDAWLLFDADWMHTKQSSLYMKYCDKVVSIGRVKWFADSKHTGKDNCCWYHFVSLPTKTVFIGR